MRPSWVNPSWFCEWRRVEQPTSRTLVLIADLADGNELYRHSGTHKLYKRNPTDDTWFINDIALTGE